MSNLPSGPALRMRKSASTPPLRSYRSGLSQPSRMPAINLVPGLRAALRKLAPRAVIVNNLGIWTAMVGSRNTPTLVYWEGTAHSERSVGRMRTAARRVLARRVSGFVSSGTEACSYLTGSLGVGPGRIRMGGLSALPMPGASDAPRPPRISRSRVRFLFVGRLIKRKGVDSFLRALARLEREKRQGYEAMIVGDGPERASLEAMMGRLDLAGVLRFAGAIPPEAIVDYYRRADVLIMPSRQDTWGLVIAEACAAGLAVLASCHAGAAADLVHEGLSGWTFDPEDDEALAAAMARYLETPELVARHGAYGREQVRAFSVDRAADAFLAAVRVATAHPDTDAGR